MHNVNTRRFMSRYIKSWPYHGLFLCKPMHSYFWNDSKGCGKLFPDIPYVVNERTCLSKLTPHQIVSPLVHGCTLLPTMERNVKHHFKHQKQFSK